MEHTFDEFVESISTMVLGVAETLEPDEDIDAVVFIASGEDTIQMFDVNHLMSDDEHKSMLATRIMPSLVKRFDAEYFGFVSAQWRMRMTDPALSERYFEWQRENPNASMADFPDHTPEEVVGVMFGSRDGTVVLRTAPMTRREGLPPLLSGWEDNHSQWTDPKDDEKLSGRMIDFVMEAITGKRLITEQSFAEIATALSSNSVIREHLVTAWEALGKTPEQMFMEFHLADEQEKQRLMMETEAKIEEMFPGHGELVRTMIMEHATPAADAYPSSAGMVVMVSEDGEMEPLDVFPEDDPSRLLDEE